MGFEHLGQDVAYEELRGTWRVIGEKELRVHVDLEDAFEEIEEIREDSGKGRRVEYR